MNLFKTLIFLLLVSTLQSNAQGHTVKSRLKKFSDVFAALPKEQKKKYVKHKEKAFKASKQQKYLTCLVELSDARAIFENDMDIMFLSGICRAQIHDVDSAIEFYEKVLEIDPNHMYTLMNLIEINFFAGRYEETIKHIKYVNSIMDSRTTGGQLPLVDFKYLISLTKLSEKNPEKYKDELDSLREKYTYMDDNPFYYYANALEALDGGDKQEGLIWVLKAYLIFVKPELIEVWNKALVDTGYIGAHEIMFNKVEKK